VREVTVATEGFDTRPEYGSGPHLALMGAAVRLARRDLEDPEHSEEAKAFLLGQPYDGSPVGVEIDLFGECLGYGGSFLNG
jgi:hypothetical protein